MVGDKAALVLGQQQGVAELGGTARLAFADRAGVRVGKRHQPVGDHPVAGQPLPGLVQQPMGCGRGLRQPGHQPSQATVVGPLGTRPTGVAGDLLGLRHTSPGNGGDFGGEPVDLGGGLPGASPQGPGDLLEPASGGAGAVAERGMGGRAARADMADQPAEGAHGVLEQVGVGGMVDVGLDDGGVDAQLAAAQDPLAGQLCQQRGVELVDRLGAGAADQLDQGGRVRHGLVQVDVAEPPPGDRVGDLAAQRPVAKLVAVLEVQQAQQGLDRDRGATQPGGNSARHGVMKRSSSR